MAPSTSSDSPSFRVAENDLQSSFVLHRASIRKPERKSAGKPRRSSDLPSQSLSKFSEAERMETFISVCSKVDSTIKEVFSNISINVFTEINQWVHESFNVIRASGLPASNNTICSYPIVSDTVSKQLFTGLLFTRNMEFVDDLLTFSNLGLYLKSHGCHLANLTSLDFSARRGISGCLRSLLRQLLMINLDAADISILASWYREESNNKNPVVVIIDDMERCCGSVLSDFILMLSDWVVKIPIILIMGVATTVDAPRIILPTNVLEYLRICKFSLGSPAERMDAIIEAVLVNQCIGFSLGYKVASFLRNNFLRQDGTLISFIKALEMAIAQHFLTEPLSFILGEFLNDDSQVSWNDIHALSEKMLEQPLDLPSCRSYFASNRVDEPNAEFRARGLSEFKRLQKLWSSVVMCLYEAGKYHSISMLDLYCEALDPKVYPLRASGTDVGLHKKFRMSSTDRLTREQHPSSCRSSSICQAVCKIRDLPAAALWQLIESWVSITEGIHEIHEKVQELKSSMKVEDRKSSKGELKDISKRHITRNNISVEKEAELLSDKAATFLADLVRDHLQPIECLPFHEIVCFNDIDRLRKALIGDPRREIQLDLLESPKFLNCTCCAEKGSIASSSMHDTSILHIFAQEHGELVNLHNWYQSFRTTVLQLNLKGKHLKHSPSLKKLKKDNGACKISEASLQYPTAFCFRLSTLCFLIILYFESCPFLSYTHLSWYLTSSYLISFRFQFHKTLCQLKSGGHYFFIAFMIFYLFFNHQQTLLFHL